MRGRDTNWFVRTPRAKARLRLLCVSFAGGGASAYHSWPQQLPSDVEVCALQLPGRETRLKEAPRTSLVGLIDQLVTETRTLRDGEYALFGHSLGGLIAFELTRALRRLGERLPNVLVVSACGAPQLARPELGVTQLSDEKLMQYLRRFEGTASAILESPELLELVLPILRADFSLRDTYSYLPEAPLDLPIVAFGGREDAHVPRAELEAWSELTSRAFALQGFDGGHFYFRTTPVPFFSALRNVLDVVADRQASAAPLHVVHSESP